MNTRTPPGNHIGRGMRSACGTSKGRVIGILKAWQLRPCACAVRLSGGWFGVLAASKSARFVLRPDGAVRRGRTTFRQ